MKPLHTRGTLAGNDQLWITVFHEIYQVKIRLFIAHYVNKIIQFRVCHAPVKRGSIRYADDNVLIVT